MAAAASTRIVSLSLTLLAGMVLSACTSNQGPALKKAKSPWTLPP